MSIQNDPRLKPIDSISNDRPLASEEFIFSMPPDDEEFSAYSGNQAVKYSHFSIPSEYEYMDQN